MGCHFIFNLVPNLMCDGVNQYPCLIERGREREIPKEEIEAMFVRLLLGSLMVSGLQCVGGSLFKRGREAEDSGTVEDQAGAEAF